MFHRMTVQAFLSATCLSSDMWSSALVNYGKDYGKLVVIVDIIDQNRVWKLPLQEDSVKQEDGFSVYASKLSTGRLENKEFNESEDVEEVEGGRGHLPFE
ncbi:hypothetical protein HHK36_032552 [Tetracentron sinense]|uniref:Uncharacterized protein n=1 Tax=Tetracentron sinense TaxID=13715 RepID=A0A835D0C0_TETSI|nr:hypothetical protein HHK36_032552 [Tetracentron sinense]